MGSSGGGVCLGLILAGVLLSSPRGGGGLFPQVAYHWGRVVGVSVEPNRDIIRAEVDRAAEAYGISRSVMRALVKVESGGNHRAESPVGARGVAQVMPFNHKRCGLRSAEDLWDPVFNVRCGARILAENLAEHDGDLRRALTVYNCGKVKCKEGQQYAQKVLSLSRFQ